MAEEPPFCKIYGLFRSRSEADMYSVLSTVMQATR